jgi:hypothetical protein
MVTIKFSKIQLDTGETRVLMKVVRCETPEAVFSFSLEDVVTGLKGSASDDEATELMNFLALQQEEVIEIPQKKNSFLYIALDLLASDKGHVFCKACGREYQANELVSFPIGAGENPLKVKVGYRESLLNRILGRQKRVPLFGGKGYKCSKGHELIGVVTWRT